MQQGWAGDTHDFEGAVGPPLQMSIIVAKNIPNGARSRQQRMLCWGRYPQRSTLARNGARGQASAATGELQVHGTW